MAIHDRAARGFARAGVADYEAGRPAYPPAAVAWLAEHLRLGPGRRVLDLAAGTGKLTRLLVPTGADVVAVEPVASMRAQIAEAPAVEGTAEAIPLAAGTVDAVTVAQALHWFAHDRAFAEIQRVLRPGGRLGLVWNVWDERVDWVARLQAIVHRHEAGVPQYRHSRWSEALDASGRFGPVHAHRLEHAPEGDLATLRARVASVSYIAALPPAERDAVLDEVSALVRKHPDLRGRSRFAMPYRVDLFWCRRR